MITMIYTELHQIPVVTGSLWMAVPQAGHNDSVQSLLDIVVVLSPG